MPQCSTSSFDGQRVYCGFDVHKRTWDVCVRINGCQVKAFHTDSDVGSIVSRLKRAFPGAEFHSVYEAGFSGFHAHRALCAAGFRNLVVNPADVPTSGRERAFKSDASDCRKLARSLENGELRGIDVPPVGLERMRGLVRRETQLRDAAVRCANQLKSSLHFHGGREVPARLGERVLRRLEAEAAEAGDFETPSLVRQLRLLREERARVVADERVLQERLGYAGDVRLLTSIPGVGLRAATVIQAELGDVSRFRSPAALASYVGLAPHLTGSGDSERAVASGSRKKKLLHSLFIQAAWIAAGRDAALCALFGRLCRRHRKTRAIVVVARKLLLIAFAVLRKKEPYDAELLLRNHPELADGAARGSIPPECAEAARCAECADEDEDDSLSPLSTADARPAPPPGSDEP
ncbi:MAG: IS110 family transposase [Victivallales bacterium]|nr:IS110 family transposase [Victivallales bacterium]